MLPFDVLRMVKGTTGGGSGGGSGGGGAGALNVLAEVIATNVGSDQATASFSLNSDGTATAINGSPSYWYDPITAGIGASYWAIVTITSGSVTSGTVGSRVQLTAGHTWTCTTTGSRAVRRNFAEGTIEIYDAATLGNLIASGTFLVSAEVDNT